MSIDNIIDRVTAARYREKLRLLVEQTVGYAEDNLGRTRIGKQGRILTEQEQAELSEAVGEVKDLRHFATWVYEQMGIRFESPSGETARPLRKPRCIIHNLAGRDIFSRASGVIDMELRQGWTLHTFQWSPAFETLVIVLVHDGEIQA